MKGYNILCNLLQPFQQWWYMSYFSRSGIFPSFHLGNLWCRCLVSGYGSTGMNAAASMVVSGVRGPFTPSQWMELEHQALIYKYITANVPIPSYLLNPIRKAFESAGFNGFSALRSNACKFFSPFITGSCLSVFLCSEFS